MNFESLVVNITRNGSTLRWTARIDGVPEASGQGRTPDAALKSLWEKALPVLAKMSGGFTRREWESVVARDADYSRVVTIDHITAEWRLPV